MSQREVKKCSYFNSGYCQYTKKENGCKNFHPIVECKIQGGKQKNVLEDTLKRSNLEMNADLEQIAPLPMLRSQ